jgi:hypothetical protein
MNYEKPELTLTDAIRAIQTTGSKQDPNSEDAPPHVQKQSISAYDDAE